MEAQELISGVSDWKSFREFVLALANDRANAEKMERENPEGFKWGGANNWQNSDISAFLESAIACADDRHFFDKNELTWRGFAEFLYGGKIYE